MEFARIIRLALNGADGERLALGIPNDNRMFQPSPLDHYFAVNDLWLSTFPQIDIYGMHAFALSVSQCAIVGGREMFNGPLVGEVQRLIDMSYLFGSPVRVAGVYRMVNNDRCGHLVDKEHSAGLRVS